MQPYIRFVYPYFFSLLFLTSLCAVAQERCGTVPYMQKLKGRKQIPENDLLFENWLQQKLVSKRLGRTRQQQGPPYKVAVVVHVIHDGDALGTGTNISDAQIQSQIDVLNADFKRLNADKIQTHTAFQPVAGAMDIEFVLAKQDPEGLPTTGIVRVRGSKDAWNMNDNYELKSQSNWPSKDYLNIWVCEIDGDLAGYAQLPEAPAGVDGLENSSNNPFTDGVVIWYKAFGSVEHGAFNLDPAFNKGRTATHEIGHFFGLRHIWGDDGSGCSGSDYVDDTPNQRSSTRGCPSPLPESCTSGVLAMSQNFLDYTDDQCMNLFTIDQVERMQVILENSPRRESLLISHGFEEFSPVPNDLGIRDILFPLAHACGPDFIPRLKITNYGDNVITSARIELKVDGALQETKDFTLNLTPLEPGELTFAPLTLSTGAHDVAFRILLTNGVTDGNSGNNERERSFVIPESVSVPFLEEFNTLTPAWTIDNPDALATWQLVNAPSTIPTNKALRMRFPDYDENYGEFDIVYSPVFDLSAAPVASLFFDVAYGSGSDRLKVLVLKNCEDILSGTTVYDKSGNDLKTTTSTSSSFVPQSGTDWRTEFADLTDFIGESHVRLAFIGINATDNNLYLDNVLLSITEFEDVNLKAMASPSPVTCTDQTPLLINIHNIGNIAINSLKIQYRLNQGPLNTINASNLNLNRGTEMTLTLDPVVLKDGSNTILINLTEPNGNLDQSPANNQREFSVIVNKSADRIPLRQNFESPFDDAWTLVNPLKKMNWQSIGTNLGTSLYFDAFDNTLPGDQAWAVSPVLDLSHVDSASMAFDHSYAHSTRGEDVLKIMVSRDCGATYEEHSTVSLAGKNEQNEWVPGKESDWQRRSVNLNRYAGEASVRVAFVAVNANGNNIFLDNIEFFASDEPAPVTVTGSYSIYGYNLEDPSSNSLKITFNLENRQDVGYTVVDAMGRQHAHGTLHDVLNQTYPLRLEENLIPGVYIVRLSIGGKYYTNRVIVAQ